MKRTLRYVIGLNRLRHGYCPHCNSSPPRHSCPICHGNFYYGIALTDETRADWREKWERWKGQ